MSGLSRVHAIASEPSDALLLRLVSARDSTNGHMEDLITCTPGVRSGKACVAGTRITVSDVLEYLASGMSQDEILADFPDLKPEHIQAVLRYAAEREKRLSELTVA